MKKIEINLENANYDIYLERGILNKLNNFIDTDEKILIITDDKIPDIWINKVLNKFINANIIKIPYGERSKNIDIYQNIIKKCLDIKLNRKDLIIALGGGVIGDLAGFVASSYMRGIDFISIPTNTLSQVDSSIGGKVAININNIKNIIGAFYHPKKVLIDFDVLKTLDRRNFINGIIEALKTGLIHDKSLFELIESDIESNLEEIIYKSLLVKKKIVEQDEKEKNIRKTLNFGHTIGHGIESYYKFEKYLHGESVAIGMLYFVENENLRARIKDLYKKLSIVYEDKFDVETVYNIICNDKKAHKDFISVCKIKDIGESYLENIKKTDIKKIIERQI